MKTSWWPLLASSLATLACLVAMSLLPGRTATHGRATMAEAAALPDANGFVLDGLHFDRHAISTDPHLEPLRQFFKKTCPAKTGLDAAVCISDEFARVFPFGAANHEFVDPQYDPVADLQAHVAGEAGHCVTRSGLAAAILLASGINARQVQIAWGGGHSIFEVYDDRYGWVMFDPTYGLTYGDPADPLSISEAVGRGRLQWTRVGLASEGRVPDLPIEVPEALYPDPWLYTRSGRRAASWPFRNHFVHVGGVSLTHGLRQEVARACFVGFGALTFVLGLLRLHSRRVMLRGRGRSSVPERAPST